ncbi:DUF808 domain-containing protein [Fulvivirga sedimenti]|uniref:DUF808 domain-containing protein n=1 Tax=Fulvivirga sedimenti TaxID=2879465 RepID=A0A9X1HYL3_9BACT|nr:DUF808 domain-containing protein [Fulvivirga sedimenti]MCA6078824.1 DUF808 domain-containing protein [Fulvivirga sedimenti]
MASGFFALLDDIATLMDDVATMSKVAAKKTAGILGDDLAVNAEKSMGFVSSRELPVLWAITKGSLLNKLMILPVAFLLSAFVPVAITVILLFGGIYLAYEGAEKIYEFFFPHKHETQRVKDKGNMTKAEILNVEKQKIRSAIVTDFILSIEIVIIALGTVVEEELSTQILVVTIIAMIATIGVYGIVALIVRMDDFGIKLIDLNEQDDSFSDKVGALLVRALPWVIKALSVIGTLALVLVSGGIFVHNLHFLEEYMPNLPILLNEFVVGLIVGGIALAVVSVVKKIIKK